MYRSKIDFLPLVNGYHYRNITQPFPSTREKTSRKRPSYVPMVVTHDCPRLLRNKWFIINHKSIRNYNASNFFASKYFSLYLHNPSGILLKLKLVFFFLHNWNHQHITPSPKPRVDGTNLESLFSDCFYKNLKSWRFCILYQTIF